MCPPVHLLYVSWYFHFCMIIFFKYGLNGFLLNLLYALILWRSGLELLIGNFFQFDRVICPATCPYFHFQTITSVNISGFSPNSAFILW